MTLGACSDDGGQSRRRGTHPLHVFVIMLENKGFTEAFGADSKAPFLARSLPAQGALLRQYHAIGHESLDNYIAIVSGQAPNAVTQADCPLFLDFAGLPLLDPNGQAIGLGCVYPSLVKTLPDQLEAAGFTWKAYMEDMGNATPGERATCRHPALNQPDETQVARNGDQYAARHDPFVYFHSIIDDGARCDDHVVPLDELPADLSRASTIANYVFITPNLCNDGHDEHCVDGREGGLAAADGFLRHWVPMILDSPPYEEDGLLAVLFDEAEGVGSNVDASACCNEPIGPNSPLPGITGLGGGRTGAVLLSPFIAPGTVSDTPYDHYSFLRSVEDLFALPHLGYAAQAGLQPFGADVYTAR
jgi:hypothetical protein